MTAVAEGDGDGADTSSSQSAPAAPFVMRSAIAGALSGTVARAVVSPLDIIKIRLQLQVEPILSSPFASAQVHGAVLACFGRWRYRCTVFVSHTRHASIFLPFPPCRLASSSSPPHHLTAPLQLSCRVVRVCRRPARNPGRTCLGQISGNVALLHQHACRRGAEVLLVSPPPPQRPPHMRSRCHTHTVPVSHTLRRCHTRNRCGPGTRITDTATRT